MEHGEPLRVLLIDDDQDFTDSLINQGHALTTKRVQLEAQNSFEETIQQLPHLNDFDLIVVDYNLNNGKTAFDLLREARNYSQSHSGFDFTRTVPVVISSNDDLETLNRLPDFQNSFLDFSVDSFLSKRLKRGYIGFESELISVHDAFLQTLAALKSKFDSSIKETDAAIDSRTTELFHILVLLKDNLRSAEHAPLRRLCDRARILAQENLELSARNHFFSSSSHGLHAAFAVEHKFEPDPLHPTDFLPPSRIRKQTVSKVKRLMDILAIPSPALTDPDEKEETISRIFSSESATVKHDILMCIMVSAEERSRTDFRSSVQMLSTLVSALERSSDFRLASAVSMSCANILRENDRTQDSKVFTAAAKQLSVLSNKSARSEIH